MAELFDVGSGNIVADVEYQVIGGTSIVYNAVTYNANDFFVGVSGQTTYTKTGGTEIVTYASDINYVSLGIENDFFLDLFSDESKIKAVSLGLDPDTNNSQIIRTQYN